MSVELNCTIMYPITQRQLVESFNDPLNLHYGMSLETIL
jgi:hypothetical protein